MTFGHFFACAIGVLILIAASIGLLVFIDNAFFHDTLSKSLTSWAEKKWGDSNKNEDD